MAEVRDLNEALRADGFTVREVSNDEFDRNVAEILRTARARESARAAAYVPPDYAAANKLFRQQKAALTRAINSHDTGKVLIACRDAVRAWGRPPFNGAWPDDWSRWQRALDDVFDWQSAPQLEDLR
jgi:hypothetical protein